jgi:very-short-patch-repair endonuclease
MFTAVYAVAHSGPVELGRETAALLACRDGAVLSHRSAGALWGLCGPPSDRAVHVTMLGSGNQNRKGITVHRTKRLDRHDVRIHKGLPVTSPARTVLDLAAELARRELERALDEALATNITRRTQIIDAVNRLPGRHGATTLKTLLNPHRPSTRTRSHPEERLHQMIRQADLPEPEVNYQIGPYSIDFYWPEHQVAFEVDGYVYHAARTTFERDHRKDAYLKSRNIDTNRLTATQVEDEPLATIARITERLAAAERR